MSSSAKACGKADRSIDPSWASTTAVNTRAAGEYSRPATLVGLISRAIFGPVCGPYRKPGSAGGNSGMRLMLGPAIIRL